MSEHPSDKQPCNLLPWYVNGTLTDAERNTVESHITACATCMQEITELEQLHAHVKHVESETQSPGELGLTRLKRRIQSESAAIKVKSPRRWLMPALAAASIMIVLQAGLIWNISDQSRQSMQLLSGPKIADIQVRFTPNAREEQIRTLLQSIHGQIVSGPGALGIYHIRIESEKNKKAAVDIAIQTLREQSAVVSFATIDGGD